MYLKTKNLLWTLPFLSFVAGYVFLSYMLAQPTLVVPSLLGKQLLDAQTLTSTFNVSIRILKQTYDEDLPDGTILHQQPYAGSTIKKNQTIFCVISRKPPLKYAPNILSKKETTILTDCKDLGITAVIHPITHHTPRGTCCAQFPLPGQPLTAKTIHVYISQDAQQLVIMPLLCNYMLEDVVPLLEQQGLTYALTQATNSPASKKLLIVDQRPQAGSVIDLVKPPLVQLYVKSI